MKKARAFSGRRPPFALRRRERGEIKTSRYQRFTLRFVVFAPSFRRGTSHPKGAGTNMQEPDSERVRPRRGFVANAFRVAANSSERRVAIDRRVPTVRRFVPIAQRRRKIAVELAERAQSQRRSRRFGLVERSGAEQAQKLALFLVEFVKKRFASGAFRQLEKIADDQLRSARRPKIFVFVRLEPSDSFQPSETAFELSLRETEKREVEIGENLRIIRSAVAKSRQRFLDARRDVFLDDGARFDRFREEPSAFLEIGVKIPEIAKLFERAPKIVQIVDRRAQTAKRRLDFQRIERRFEFGDQRFKLPRPPILPTLTSQASRAAPTSPRIPDAYALRSFIFKILSLNFTCGVGRRAKNIFRHR